MGSLPLPIAAFFAGLISFLSPCVLPLVPGYVSLISGAGVE
jgi:cytochrome c-type biogenesis protein